MGLEQYRLTGDAKKSHDLEYARLLAIESENQMREAQKTERKAKLILYNNYISSQKEYFYKLLNLINENIVNDLNAKGGIITSPIRLEARTKSPDSALENDAKARDPIESLNNRGKDIVEQNSDLSDIFGITIIYPGDEIDEKAVKKSMKSGKPYPQTETNQQIEKLIIDKLKDFFVFHQISPISLKESDSLAYPNVKRKFKPGTFYDSLHATAHLKDDYYPLLIGKDDKHPNLSKEFIPQIEVHVTSRDVHERAALDPYHLLKFASFEDRSNYNRAKQNNELEKADAIMEKVKQELQEEFNKKGYHFISDTSLPEMFASTSSGEIVQLPKTGLNGVVKKLFPFLDISKAIKIEERNALKANIKNRIELNRARTKNGNFKKMDTIAKQLQEKSDDEYQL